MMKRSEPLLLINIIALGVALILLVAIFAILLWVFLSSGGLFFGMMLAFLFPVFLVCAIAGAVVYIALLVSNAWVTVRRKKAGTIPKRLGYIWLIFGGLTTTVALITVICGIVSMPLVAVLARTVKVSNPFLTAPVRSVPTYPSTVWDDQSQYDEVKETLFRSYNVPNSHPDDVADWYQSALSEPPWSVLQVNRYVEDDKRIGRIVRYCIQAQLNEGSEQQRTYYVEIFGQDDETSFWGTHVNIGTPKPITDVCERFLDEP
jgi:hypothetical protein